MDKRLREREKEKKSPFLLNYSGGLKEEEEDGGEEEAKQKAKASIPWGDQNWIPASSREESRTHAFLSARQTISPHLKIH